jgi:hypothetical protein
VPAFDISKYFNPDIVSRFAEVQQSRSAFQIEKFVVGQHDTPEMQYYQCVLEIQSLYYTIKEVILEMEIAELEITKLRTSQDPIDELKAQIKELGLEKTKVVGVGAFRELEILLSILNNYPRYSREDIEIAQPTYWNNRLERQATAQAIGGSQHAASNIEALMQIGAIDLKKEIEA